MAQDRVPWFHYPAAEDTKYSAYVDAHSVSIETAKRHEGLRHTLAECGGYIGSVQQLQKLMSQRGILASRQQLEADIEFLKKTSR